MQRARETACQAGDFLSLLAKKRCLPFVQRWCVVTQRPGNMAVMILEKATPTQDVTCLISHHSDIC